METLYLLDTTLTEDELMLLRDSSFAFSDSIGQTPEDTTTIVDTAMIRIDECTHGDYQCGTHQLRLRCAITDHELDALDAAASEANPASLAQTLTRFRNVAEPVDQLFEVDLFVPADAHDLFSTHGSTSDVLGTLADGSTRTVSKQGTTIDIKTHIFTYITAEERDALTSLEDESFESDIDLAPLCEAIADVSEPFDPAAARRAFVEEYGV